MPCETPNRTPHPQPVRRPPLRTARTPRRAARHLAAAVVTMTLLLASCSVAQTAQVLHEPQSQVTPQQQVAVWAAAQRVIADLPSPGPSGCAYEGLIRSVFVEDPDWAIAIAIRESHCQPDAYNPSGSEGLFQLYHHDDLLDAVGCTAADWAEPWCNVRAAHLLYLGTGRAPWNL